MGAILQVYCFSLGKRSEVLHSDGTWLILCVRRTIACHLAATLIRHNSNAQGNAIGSGGQNALTG